MARRILLIVLLLVLAAFVYVGYKSYDAKRSEASGDVFSRDSSPVRMKSDTTVPANSEDKAPGQQTVVYPAAPTAQATQPLSDNPTPAAAPSGTTAAPGTDSISPNPPNGMAFSGTGHYQLYRQGNLTWRVNTDTGQTCILFATDEEWKKPKVYRNGCDKH